MKHHLIRAFAALTMLLLAAAPAHAEWREAKSENFTVVGDMSDPELRKWTEQLEQYHGMLSYVLNAKRTVPVTVYVLGGLGDVQRAGGGDRGIAGFYSATAQGANAVVPERLKYSVEDFTPRVILLHEYAHHMLLTNVDMFMPGWAQEGLAEMFATAKFEDDGSVVIGDKNDARADAMFGMSRWSVKRMLESDFSPPKDPTENIEKYSRGWALAHYLWMSGERPKQYGDFIAELNRTIDPVASGEKVFGNLGKLDRELDRYIRVHKFNLSRFSPDLIGTPGPIKVRTLSEAEAAMLDYRLVSTLGVNDKTAGPLAERARPVAAQYINSAPVQTWMAEIEYDAKNYDGSWAAADRALALDPDSLFAMVYKGRVLMRRAIAAGDRTMAAQAREWFLKANRLQPDHALPFQLYYDSFLALGEPAPKDAVEGLYSAAVLVPQDPSLRVRATLELLREGNISQARTMLAPVAFQPEGIGENKALKLIREMERTDDTAALLAKATELKLDRVNEFIEPEDEDEDG